jgi:uncharacterized protein YggU (UPF0235/DUF167 family)
MPGSTRPGVVGPYGGSWKIRVAVAPEGGRANDAVVGLLADTLDLRRADIEIISGHSGRDKVVSVQGISGPELERRLASAAGSS